jgi:hypothetical protein
MEKDGGSSLKNIARGTASGFEARMEHASRVLQAEDVIVTTYTIDMR